MNNINTASLTRIEFSHKGARHVAIAFRRNGHTAGVEIYIVGVDGLEEFMRYARPEGTALDRKAIHVVSVADADVSPSVSERFAALEMM